MTSKDLTPDTVYFFGTCIINSVYPQTGLSAIRLLKREGIRVIYPLDQSCCGQPAYNSGFPEEARKTARKQMKLFPKNLPIIVPSGSCAGMMKHHYPRLFEGEPDFDSVHRFSQRIFEWSEFLNRILKVKLEDEGKPIDITWHSSCHASREMDVIEDSKSLLRQLHHVRLIDLENEEQCCGFGGAFSIKQPEISNAMVKDKVNAIVESGAEVVVSGDCGCLLNINGAMDFQKIPIKGMHLADFLWERTDAK